MMKVKSLILCCRILLFVMTGQQVTTADEWEKVRRPEILEIFMSKGLWTDTD